MLDAQVLAQDAAQPGRAPGAVIVVFADGAKFVKARGVADLAGEQALSIDDRFEIGSITKMFTAVLLLQLHEEGTLSLDDPVARWLPEIAAQLPHAGKMTLRQLASHTAGLENYEQQLYPMPDLLTDVAVLERAYAKEDLVALIAEQSPLFEPGAPGQWSYSSAGYALIGLVLEAASGQALGTLYQNRIFDPLGLESAIVLDTVPNADQIVSGYFGGRGELVDVTRWNPSGAFAAGSLAMNATDLVAFAQALLEGDLFTDQATLAEMTDFVPTGQERGFTGYGLGIAELEDGVLGHAGGTPGFAAQLLTWPDEEIAAVYLANSGTANMPPNQFAARIETILDVK